VSSNSPEQLPHLSYGCNQNSTKQFANGKKIAPLKTDSTRGSKEMPSRQAAASSLNTITLSKHNLQTANLLDAALVSTSLMKTPLPQLTSVQ
jgi:hypothetical protein